MEHFVALKSLDMMAHPMEKESNRNRIATSYGKNVDNPTT